MERQDPRIHPKTLRLNRFLAMAGLGSRRSMDSLISSGSVTVNGSPVASLGLQVRPGKDRVAVDGREIELAERQVYILLNKPKDAITTLKDERGRTTVLDYVKVKQRVFPVGRLDRNTTGVLILTNDGMLAQSLLHPKHAVERVYKVTIDEPLSDAHVRTLRKGVRLDDGLAHATDVGFAEKGKKKVFISLTEGRNREVRRMFEALGYDVRQLDRISYAGLTARGLPRGRWRFLSKEEVLYLRKVTAQRGPSEPRRYADEPRS